MQVGSPILGAWFLAALAGCGSPGQGLEPLAVPAGCNPLAADWDCTLPYPSDHFLVEDPALPSGRRVLLTQDALVRHQDDGRPVDPTSLHPADGFSHLPTILALFPGGVDDGDLVFHTGDIARTLRLESPTALLDATSLEPIPHFAEMDPRAATDERRALVIRPLVRLAHQRRYLVAISGLRDRSGAPVEAPEGFRRLRDAQARGDPALETLAERYENAIFPRLREAGIQRESLQLAWDFTTGSDESVTGDLLTIRAQVLTWLESHAVRVEVDRVIEEAEGPLALLVEGRFEVPLYLETTEPGALLHRDAAGRVAQNGLAETPFVLVVPRSVAGRAAGDPPGRLVQFGHGFFESREKITEARLVEMAHQSGWVLVATDFWGMNTGDLGGVVDDLLYRPSELAAFTDRIHQAMANFIVLAAAAQGPLAALPALQVEAGGAYDPDRVYFWGVSMGHLLGATYVTLSPVVERAVLTAGGVGLGLIMFRSVPFALLLSLIEMFAPDPLDTQKYVAQLLTALDRVDAISYAPHTLEDTLPGGPATRRVLLEMALSDSEVPNLAACLHARIMGIGLLQPAPVEVFGLPETPAPSTGSALVAHDFGIDPATVELAQPPESTNGVHTQVSRLEATRRQMDAFFQPEGLIEHTCDGVCDPE